MVLLSGVRLLIGGALGAVGVGAASQAESVSSKLKLLGFDVSLPSFPISSTTIPGLSLPPAAGVPEPRASRVVIESPNVVKLVTAMVVCGTIYTYRGFLFEGMKYVLDWLDTRDKAKRAKKADAQLSDRERQRSANQVLSDLANITDLAPMTAKQRAAVNVILKDIRTTLNVPKPLT